jgi:hypothetical protein
MYRQVNECYTRMWGDRFHRAEFTSIIRRERDGANIVEGWMRADTPDALKAEPRPMDVPFRIAIPAGLNEWDFHQVNTNIFYRLINGESLIDLDYAPPPPQLVQSGTNWGHMLLVGVIGAVVIGIASSSRN